MKFVTLFICILSIYGIRSDDGPQCKAPNGEGLQNVLNEFSKLMPYSELIQIFMKAVSNDPEVKKAMEYVTSEDFKNLVVVMINTPEFKDLMEFSCKNLYFDSYYYYNKIAKILDLPPITRPPIVKRSINKARPGFNGMLLDMLDIIPVDKLRALFEEKLKTDKYLQLAIETMKGDNFKKIISTLIQQNQYKLMVEELRKMGVKIDDIIAFLKKFFEW